MVIWKLLHQQSITITKKSQPVPVEIKELVIKAVVEEAAGSGNGPGAQGSTAAPEAIIQVCIDRVLEILKEQKER